MQFETETFGAPAGLCRGACVEVDSDTEAVANEGFKLGCISCKMRAEVPARAVVTWEFRVSEDQNFSLLMFVSCRWESEIRVQTGSRRSCSGSAFLRVGSGSRQRLTAPSLLCFLFQLYEYEEKRGDILDPRFEERLDWNGSKNTEDLQDGSIYILNVTFNDTGTYRCTFRRTLIYTNYNFENYTTKLIHLHVVPKLTRSMASILSEVMMYVSIIGLQLWLVVEMIYCYRKISAAGEEALRETETRIWIWTRIQIQIQIQIRFSLSLCPCRAEYLAVASESKENCGAVQEAE
ncbi:hypothetical protein CCH79_00018564 [Gambusia affinis]|uniref:Sodium channel regulatory subunit beta-3 n=1 Tax=Gambusia affinis TaxID=33528 RepID=A0A315VXS7_GAMAF|nr:hypothetical protein CCH79_00018564 [Gambusia affinis]